MRRISIAAVLGIVLAPISWASATPLPDGGVTAQEVAQILQKKGFQADVAADSQGDPMVRSTSGGAKFQIAFYECHGQQRCPSIQFYAGFAKTGLTQERATEWIRKKRFGRVYLDDESDPWIEMDVDVRHGATTEAVGNDLDRWVSLMGEFMRYLGQ